MTASQMLLQEAIVRRRPVQNLRPSVSVRSNANSPAAVALQHRAAACTERSASRGSCILVINDENHSGSPADKPRAALDIFQRVTPGTPARQLLDTALTLRAPTAALMAVCVCTFPRGSHAPAAPL